MNQKLEDAYLRYRKNRNRDTGEDFAVFFLNTITDWEDFATAPASSFLDDFINFYQSIQSEINPSTDLIDLGLLQFQEAVLSHFDHDSDATIFYLKESALPFQAFLDQKTYRLSRKIVFREVDFQIFEIIGGDFPHDTAQTFLESDEYADVWLALRYFDSIDPDRVDSVKFTIESMLITHKSLPERIVLLTYLILRDKGEENDISLPADIHSSMLAAFYEAKSCVRPDDLSIAFEDKLSPNYYYESLFFLLCSFEITEAEIGPGWIRLFELSISRFWIIHDTDIVQPLQEFVASILHFIPSDTLSNILQTSLLLVLFFDNIDEYNEPAFEELVTTLSIEEHLLKEEMELRLLTMMENGMQPSHRYYDCAGSIGYMIEFEEGQLHWKKII